MLLPSFETGSVFSLQPSHQAWLAGQQAPSKHPLIYAPRAVLEACAWVASGLPSFQWEKGDPERWNYMLKVLSLYKRKPRFEPREVCPKPGSLCCSSQCIWECAGGLAKHLGIWGIPSALPAEVCLQRDAPGLRVIVGFATGMFELSHSVSSNFLLLPSQLLVRRFVKVTSSSWISCCCRLTGTESHCPFLLCKSLQNEVRAWESSTCLQGHG